MSRKLDFKSTSDWQGVFVLALFIAAVLLIFAHLHFYPQDFLANSLGFAGLLLILLAAAVFKLNESRVKRISLESERQRQLREHVEEALREAHKEIDKTKKHLESLIDSSTDSIIATDRDGNVILFNTGAEAMLGHRREEILGRYVTMVYSSEESAKGVMRQMRQSDGKVTAIETLLKTKGGDLIPVLISASILYDEEGNEAGTVGFSKDLRDRKELEHKLEELAITDAVTRLYNRTYFASKLEEEFQRALRYNIPLSLMILDMDFFKSVNDTFGHRAGDAYLKAVARLVSAEVRSVDTVARYGGEEIVVIMPHTKPNDAVAVAERLREKVASLEVLFEGHAIRRTVSIGVTSYPDVTAEAADDLLKVADSALYEAKRRGRNMTVIKSDSEGLEKDD